MSAFGRKNGPNGAKPGFGVARPMQHTPGANRDPEVRGGDQFPPIDPVAIAAAADPLSAASPQEMRNAEALARLSDRANQEHAPQEQAQGFEASVHKLSLIHI